MTAMLDRFVPSMVSADAETENPSTTLEIAPLTGAKRVAGLVMFLHSAGVDEVGFEPRADGRYQLEVACSSEALLTAFLESTEFRPKAVRSFASGRLEISQE